MKQIMNLGGQEIQTGIWKIGQHAGALWTEGNNVVFRDLGFRRTGGALVQGVLDDQARHIVQAYKPATVEKRVFFGTDTAIEMFAQVAGVWSNVVIGTWPTAGQYASLETWGNWLIATNGIDPVKIWKDVGGLVDLAGTPFTKAKIIKRKLVFLFAFNTNNIGDTAAEWSSDSNPEDWAPTSTNKAGNINIRDLDSEVVAAVDLGNNLAVYSRSSLVIGRFVGGADVWNWSRAISGIGAISNRSVVTLDPFNYGLTQNGIFKTDGSSFVFVDDPAMLKYIRDTADFSKGHLFWGFADAELKNVTFNFLDSDDSWHQVCFYPDKGIFTKGDLQLTAGAREEVFQWPIVAADDMQWGFWQAAEQHLGTDIMFNLRTKPLDFGAQDSYKLHNLTHVEGQWAEGNLRVRKHLHSEDPGEVIYDRPLVVDNYFSHDAKMFSWEFYGSKPIYITGMSIYGIATGVAR